MKCIQSTLAVAFLLCSSCSEQAHTGSGEPFTVYRIDEQQKSILADFFPGPLPSARALDDTDAATNSGAEGTGEESLAVTLNPGNRIVVPGSKAKAMSGLLSTNSAAVALALDSGSGYWVLPAGSPDLGSDGKFEFKVKCDFAPTLAAGYHDITAVAIGPDGTFGAADTKKLCVAGRTADYINACEPKSATAQPPQAVISLSWDTDVDLDLQVVPPNDYAIRVVSPKRPVTIERSADGILPDEAGFIDRDSNAMCNIDGVRYENLVWQKVRPDGTWGIYVDLFDACKQSVVHFTISVYVAKSYVSKEGETYERLVQVGESRHGVLLASQASGGTGRVGTYLFEVNF